MMASPTDERIVTTIVLRDCDARSGGKAARLGALLRAGFDVPDGFVIPIDAQREDDASLVAAIRSACVRLGEGPFAVRSSALGEDGASASFAGQFVTVLDVTGHAAIADAARQCWASFESARVHAYSGSRGAVAGGMAVLVQSMVKARAAGVAFSADPVTGDRSVVRVSAIDGVGEALVGGERSAEEWTASADGAPRRVAGPVDVLGAEDVAAIAALAREVEAHEGHPVDIEWAIGPAGLMLLQARPITALPEHVTWEAPPLSGGFIRNLRLGEWIGEPVTPLFESWCLTRMERAFGDLVERVFGVPVPGPDHVVIHGWYFYRLYDPMPATLGGKLRMLARTVWSFATSFRLTAGFIPPIAHLGLDAHTEQWRTTIRPAYDAAIARAEKGSHHAPLPELLSLVDDLCDRAGDHFISMVAVAGYAAKAELPLMKFYREHLEPKVGGTALELVRGAGEHAGPPGAHAVQQLDWMHPTVGELDVAIDHDPARTDAVQRTCAEREQACKEALAPLPKLEKKLAKLIAAARKGHALRLEQSAELTLGWPAMRALLAKIGAILVARGAIEDANDVHFLRRDELEQDGDRRVKVAERRRAWTRSRRLAPPLVIGELPKEWRDIFAMIDDLTGVGAAPKGALRGMPASPGRVTAVARVLRSLEEIDRLRPGEILVAPVTTPAWTAAFARAAGVITDSGSIASHASVVAREYGIPAVVATGDATAQVRDGTTVTVDGTRGWIELG